MDACAVGETKLAAHESAIVFTHNLADAKHSNILFMEKAMARAAHLQVRGIDTVLVVPLAGARPLPFRPFLSNGVKVDFVYLIATMPGRHSGDQVHKVKKAAAPSLFYFA